MNDEVDGTDPGGARGMFGRAASRSASTSRADRHVVRRCLRSPRRWRPILAAFATGQFVLAQVGRLDQGEVVLAHDRPFLLRLWRERRNSAVWRIHDQRRPTTHAFVCGEHRRVVRAADILFRPAVATVSGPLIGGVLSDAFGLQTALAVTPLFGIAAAWMLVIGSRTYERDMKLAAGVPIEDARRAVQASSPGGVAMLIERPAAFVRK